MAFAAAGLDGIAQSRAEAAVTPPATGTETTVSDQARAAHFQADGGINNAYLVDQLAANGQSIADLAFITSISGGNLELLGQGGAGTFVKLNYLDGSGTERTGLAVSTGTDNPIISIAPEANGSATLDLENNDLVGVETVVPTPDNNGQLNLDGLLALTPQAEPAVPATGGVLYVDAADGGLKFIGSSGTVTAIAPA
ncbi:MAG TPA: hypothetical protein VHN16_17055 [Streptosporangiaceae bacterium]|nr:hypothetical protein [Streptosporangiaceae bacterium]